MQCPHCQSNHTSSSTSGDWGTILCLDCDMSTDIMKIGMMWFVVKSEEVEDLTDEELDMLLGDED